MKRSQLRRRGGALLRERGIAPSLLPADANRAEVLVEVAQDKHAEMILAGHTGTGYIMPALLGSAAENVLAHAPCHVLVMR